MRRFAFKLERLLELRAWRERRAELLLAERAARCLMLGQRLESIARGKASTRRAMFAPGRGLEDYRAAELYIVRLDRERDLTTAELAVAEIAREEARAEYVVKHRDREAIDKLKDRRRDEYYKLAEREETKNLDDLARRRTVGAGE